MKSGGTRRRRPQQMGKDRPSLPSPYQPSEFAEVGFIALVQSQTTLGETSSCAPLLFRRAEIDEGHRLPRNCN